MALRRSPKKSLNYVNGCYEQIYFEEVLPKKLSEADQLTGPHCIYWGRGELTAKIVEKQNAFSGLDHTGDFHPPDG